MLRAYREKEAVHFLGPAIKFATNKIKDVRGVYMVIFMPRGVGKDPNFVLIPNSKWSASKNAIALKQNIGLDKNHDGQITERGSSICTKGIQQGAFISELGLNA